ncbi:MAG: hypothetical protein AAFV93_13325 [Chloroflexota bacterium]
MTHQQSGQAPSTFKLRDDLDNLPDVIRQHETHFHTMLTHDPDTNEMYYALLNVGVVKLSADMQTHTIVPLPDNLKTMNFHSVRLCIIKGEKRLILTANDHQQVIVMKLDGTADVTLGRPTLEPYQSEDAVYKPTDTVLVGDKLYIADGYGDQYIVIADMTSREWVSYFGGKTENRTEQGKFRTAHSIVLTPDGQNLLIVDRWNSRLQIHDVDSQFVASQPLPYNAWLCGIDFIEWNGQHYGVIACLYDVDEDKKYPAPIYIVDDSYQIISTIRPKEDFGIQEAQRLHNAIWHVYDNRLFLVCHSWNIGKYFILEQIL